MRTGRAAAVVAALGLVMAGPANADLSASPASLTVSFANGQAAVTVIVTNTATTSAPLTIRYAGKGGNVPVTRAVGAGVSLIGRTGLKVGPMRAAAVTVTFHRQKDKPPLDGVLLITTKGSTLSVPIAEAAGFAQGSNTISATSWLGPVSRSCRFLRTIFDAHGWCIGQHYSGTKLTVEAAGVVPHSTLIGGDNGRTMTVALASGTDPAHAVLEAKHIPAPSSYTGNVALGTGAATPSTTTGVTVHARDSLLWALAAIAVGVWISYLLTGRREPRRAADGLRASLQHALEPYLDSPRDPVRPDRHYLDALLLLDSGGVPLGIESQCADPVAGESPTEAFRRLYLDTYSVSDADVRASTAAGVASMVSRFARWQQLDDAFAGLNQALGLLPPDHPIYSDGLSKLDLAQGEPADDDEAKERIEGMSAFALVAHIYSDAEAAWQTKAPGWQATHGYLDPAQIYDASDTSTPDGMAKLRLALLRARRLLAQPEAPAYEPILGILGNLTAFAVQSDVYEANVASLPAATLAPAVTPTPVTAVFRDEAAIRRAVREWDWLVFLVVGVLTALAYTIAFYNGKNWGSLTDYLLAIASGATVTSVVNWALLPSARTLTTKSASS